MKIGGRSQERIIELTWLLFSKIVHTTFFSFCEKADDYMKKRMALANFFFYLFHTGRHI